MNTYAVGESGSMILRIINYNTVASQIEQPHILACTKFPVDFLNENHFQNIDYGFGKRI